MNALTDLLACLAAFALFVAANTWLCHRTNRKNSTHKKRPDAHQHRPN